MLSYIEKRKLENELISIIRRSGGINTRDLISQALNNLRASIPRVNRHHAAGMIAWLMVAYNFSLVIRTPGFSIIA